MAKFAVTGTLNGQRKKILIEAGTASEAESEAKGMGMKVEYSMLVSK